MLKPKIIKLPDYTDYVGKEFVVTKGGSWEDLIEYPSDEEFQALSEDEQDEIEEKFEYLPPYNIYAGMKFKITKIKKNVATIKIISPFEDCKESIDEIITRLSNSAKEEIEIFDTIIGWWDSEPHLFEIDENSYWNRDRDGDGRGHCINTSYNGIPADHPDKYGMAKARYDKNSGKYLNDDSIMTLDYMRTDGRLNIYSYQSNQNIFYSKATYEFMRLGKLKTLEEYESGAEGKRFFKEWLCKGSEIRVEFLNALEFEML